MNEISFLGLGVMGKYMAVNLVKSKKFHRVNVWNRSKTSEGFEFATANGAIGYTSPIDACQNARVICICVSNSNAVKDILFGQNGIDRNLKPGTTIIDFSTIGETSTLEIHKRLEKKGVKFIDVPVSGGDVGAEKGTLTLMIGAKESECTELNDIFEAVGGKAFFCGKVGSGQLIKSINQLLCSIHMVAVCEAFKLAEASGMNKKLVADVCSTGAAGSWALSNLGSEIVKDNFQPGFMVKHMVKDLNLVSEIKEEGLPLVAFDYAKQKFQETADLDNQNGKNLGTQAMYLTYK